MKSRLGAVLILGLSWLGHARADPPSSSGAASASDGSEESRLRLRLVVPVWLPLMSAESSAASVDAGNENLELESEVSWIVLGVVEAGYRPVIARVDVFGVGFGEQVVRKNGEPSEISFDSSGFVGRAVLMYELGTWKLGRRDRRQEFSVAPLAGGRYNRIGLESGEANEWSGSYHWLDPLVGARTELLLGDFRIGTHVDFGGFGVSSDIAFWASATGEYLATSWFSMWLGWQHYQVLFEEETKRGDQRLRLYLTGPAAGLSLNVF